MERKMEKVFCNISDKEHRSNRFNSWYFTPLFFCLNKKKRGLRDVVEESQASFIYKKNVYFSGNSSGNQTADFLPAREALNPIREQKLP